MDNNSTFYTIPLQKIEYEYNVDAWAPYVRNWIFNGYKPATEYNIIPLNDTEIVAIRKNLCKFLHKLEKKINKVLIEPMFFRISTLSPKDAYIKLAPHLEILSTDDQTTQENKLQMQLDLLKVSSFKEICKLIQNSNRVIEDLDFYISDETTKETPMSIILQEYRPSTKHEYRIFVKNSIIVARCPFDDNSPSLNHQLIIEFIENLSSRLTLKNYVVDVFLGNNSKIYFIEINPYSINTDSLIFSWFKPPLGPL